MSEQIYTINLSAANGTDRRQRARKAISMLKDYIERHTGAIPLIGQNLNKSVWSHGGKRVATTFKISVNVDNGYAKSELFGHAFNEKTKAEINKERSEKPKKEAKAEKKETPAEKTEDQAKKSHKDDSSQETKKAHDLKKETKSEKVDKKSKYKTSNIESHQSKSK